MTVYTCGRCGALCNKEEAKCSQCGRRFPALFGLRRFLDQIFARESRWAFNFALLFVALFLLLTCVAVRRGDVGVGFDRFSAGGNTLVQFGMLVPNRAGDIYRGEWWRVVTANLLHLGVLHLIMNCMAMVQAGEKIEQLYGPARMTIIFFVSGVIGFLASLLIDPVATAGASAGISGLVGALFAYGKRRGGNLGADIRNFASRWVLFIVGFGLLVPRVNNLAHLGGIVGGFGVAWFFDIGSLPRAGRESDAARLGALAVVAGVVICCGFAIHAAVDSGFALPR